MILPSGDDFKGKAPVERGSNAASGGRPGTKSGNDRDMGVALRKVYQRAVEEAIPPEMLDLLGKLD